MTLTLADGQRLEIGQAGQVGGEGGFFPGDEARELDEEFGLVGEVGDFFTTGAVAMAGFGGGRVAAILGMGMVGLAAGGQQQRGTKSGNQGLVHSVTLPVSRS